MLPMKNQLVPLAFVFALAGLVGAGCVELSIGGKKKDSKPPTIEQQLNDLEAARKSGAITQEQYETQRTKLLENQ